MFIYSAKLKNSPTSGLPRSVQIINLFIFTSSEIFGLTQFISTSLCALIIGHGKQSDYR